MKKECLHSHSSWGKSAFLPAASASNTWGIGFLRQTLLCHTNPLNRTNTADVTAEGRQRRQRAEVHICGDEVFLLAGSKVSRKDK